MGRHHIAGRGLLCGGMAPEQGEDGHDCSVGADGLEYSFVKLPCMGWAQELNFPKVKKEGST